MKYSISVLGGALFPLESAYKKYKFCPHIQETIHPNGMSSTLRRRLGKLPLLLHPHRDRHLPWSTHLFGANPLPLLSARYPQILHMHWVAASRVSLSALSHVAGPIVWTFHDVWPLTAGCHCNLNCDGWASGCQDCPQLKQGLGGMQVAGWLWQDKANAVRAIKNITAICPSRWIRDMAERSPIWRNRRIEHIPNTLDQTVFAPGDREKARIALALPKEALVVAFGANGIEEYHKGIDLLFAALRALQAEFPSLHLLCFGGEGTSLPLPCPATFSGFVHDKRNMARIYQAADIFVAPSRQDNLPTTLIEAASCGIPSVSFRIGGIEDIVLHGESGYMARPFEVDDLACGIRALLLDADLRTRWGRRAQEHAVTTFAEERVVRLHMALYESLLRSATSKL